MKKQTRKLTLAKETVKNLATDSLRDIAGGVPPTQFTCQPQCRTYTCPTWIC